MRSMASTIMNERGLDPEVIGVALAHLDKDEVSIAYNRADYVERRRSMMTWWSEHIQEAATGNMSISALIQNRDRKVVTIR
ncbi:Prophage CP4-57 integrase [compost metagenome]